MELNIQTAELALREASESNPGAWADHSRFVAEACKNIASHCKDLSSGQAYIFGLLHDIGRYAGVSSEPHKSTNSRNQKSNPVTTKQLAEPSTGKPGTDCHDIGGMCGWVPTMSVSYIGIP